MSVMSKLMQWAIKVYAITCCVCIAIEINLIEVLEEIISFVCLI